MEGKNAAAAAEAESTLVETAAQETEGRSKKRSSKDDNQRSTAAALEAESTLVGTVVHEAPRNVTAKQAIYGMVWLISSADVRVDVFSPWKRRRKELQRARRDKLNTHSQELEVKKMHTKSSQILDAATAATCGQGSDCRKQRPLGDEHPERIPEEHLDAQMIHQVGEAGSIVLHNSRSSSVSKNESKEIQETTSAAAKKNDECVDKDSEILRLIEERRNVPKEERQRLKSLSKNFKKCIREKKRMKRQQDIERILEEFKGVRSIPRIKKAKKRVLITKIKNEKGECITSRKGIADTFGEFYKRLYEDSGQDNSEHEMRDDKRIPEITSEELQSAISKLKAGKSPDGNGIRAEDVKDCNDETREMMRQIFNGIIKRNKFRKKVKTKVIYQER